MEILRSELGGASIAWRDFGGVKKRGKDSRLTFGADARNIYDDSGLVVFWRV
jgi:hypothetical protein